MSDWRKKAEIRADVIYFSYSDPQIVSQADEVHIWDLDKTYLDTKFESIKGLFRTAFEKPFQKKNVPGTAALARSLRGAWLSKYKKDRYPIYFITASPPQLEQKILEKLKIDGIYPFGLFCKDNMQNLKPKRLWRLSKQVGYKVQALLQLRQHLSPDVRQILWGDDSETDAVVYSLYSDICSRRLGEEELRKILRSFHVVGGQMDTIFELQKRIPKQDPVEKIYINLETDTDPEYYVKFGRRVVATFNTFQIAIDLFQDGRLGADHVVNVAQDMMFNFGFTHDELEKSFDGLIRRQIIGVPCVEKILPALQEKKIIHKLYEPSMSPKEVVSQIGERVFELEGSFEPWIPEHIDYLHDYR